MVAARFLILVFSLLSFTSCGKQISSTPNDAAPTSGTIVAQGSFAGGTIQGSVTIYDMSGGSYIVRLVSFSAPSESGMQLKPYANSQVVTTLSLRASSGNQNYTVVAGTNATWNQIVVHSVQQNSDLGVAALTATR